MLPVLTLVAVAVVVSDAFGDASGAEVQNQSYRRRRYRSCVRSHFATASTCSATDYGDRVERQCHYAVIIDGYVVELDGPF